MCFGGEIREGIESVVASKQVRLKELAESLNLSITTVSRALGGYSDVSAKTRGRVAEAAAAIGYVPSRIGRMLVSGRSNFVGMVLPVTRGETMDPFMGEFVAGLAEGLAERERDLVLAAVPPGKSDLDLLRHMVDGLRADAVVLNRLTCDDPRVGYLAERGVPFVTHGRVLTPGLAYPWLDTDGKGAFVNLARRLARLGHRHFALIGPIQPYSYAHFRRIGFESGLASVGIALAPKTIATASTGPSGDAVAVAGRLLDADPRPTALICLTDRLAFAALNAARQRGLSIPQDLSVVGFDDVPTAAHASPPLTTFSQRTGDTVISLCAMIETAIEKGNGAVEPQLITPTFIERASHGPAPATL